MPMIVVCRASTVALYKPQSVFDTIQSLLFHLKLVANPDKTKGMLSQIKMKASSKNQGISVNENLSLKSQTEHLFRK